MAQVREIEHGNSEEFEERVFGGRLVVRHGNGVRNQLPVRLGETAVRHGAIDDLVVSFAGLQQDSAREQKRIRRGVDHGASRAPDSQRAADVEEARGVHVEPHVAVRSVDEGIARAARYLQVAFCFQFVGVAVIDDLVGSNDVVAVVNHDSASSGPRIGHPGLAIGLQLNRHATRRNGLRFCDGNGFLSRVVGKLRRG